MQIIDQRIWCEQW